jgi:hypothetical protein
MLKAKHPSMFTEYLFRAARSEGPVSGYLFRLEEVLDFYSFALLAFIFGMKRKKKK